MAYEPLDRKELMERVEYAENALDEIIEERNFEKVLKQIRITRLRYRSMTKSERLCQYKKINELLQELLNGSSVSIEGDYDSMTNAHLLYHYIKLGELEDSLLGREGQSSQSKTPPLNVKKCVTNFSKRIKQTVSDVMNKISPGK